MFELVWFIAIGAAAGWLARRIMHRPELNLVANMALGTVGRIWFVGRARAPD